MRSIKTPIHGCIALWLCIASVYGKEPAPLESLFNGKDLSGWSVLPAGQWKIEDGVIRGTSRASEKRHGMLVSEKSYRDFEITIEYKAIAGNSGLYFRSKYDKRASKMKGFQAEIDASGKHPGGLYETGGRTWVVKPDRTSKAFKPGQWNEMRVRAQGRDVIVFLNGVKTAELKNDSGSLEGYFGLQLHGGQRMDVSFRNIRIRELH